jgi:SAM-dependent methyltransferase
MERANECPACGADGVTMDGQYDGFATLGCRNCGHMMLERSIKPKQSDDYIVADDAALRRMLKATRDKEFDLSVALTKKHVLRGSWLDIGCSFGWFLERIKYGGYAPFGVEPSPTAFSSAEKAFPGNVLNGEFPSVLNGVEQFPLHFDVLSAMDVLEHIQDPASFLRAAHQKLASGGVLVLKVPSNDGVLFRVASKLSSRRSHGIFGRMWQIEFNYPHWHYYSKRSIRQMLDRHGFSVIADRSIPFSFFSTAHTRVRNYGEKPERIISHAAKTIAAYGLIFLSYLTGRFDNIIVVARPRP